MEAQAVAEAAGVGKIVIVIDEGDCDVGVYFG